MENRLPVFLVWTLRVLGDALWTYKCHSSIPSIDNILIYSKMMEQPVIQFCIVLPCLLWQQLFEKAEMPFHAIVCLTCFCSFVAKYCYLFFGFVFSMDRFTGFVDFMPLLSKLLNS